jgi:DNA invertase Pin-like site-specific DNA recombinase
MQRMAPIPAAQYLRMSTKNQQYSLDNQAAAIHSYAEKNGFHVVRSYADAAKTGISFETRPALNRLIRDVINGTVPFKAILVYDITRWGRFQDSDEAAHYEFICKQARIPVHYCAETFTNDGSISSSLMKALKRAMAAEFSRELGMKVFAAGKRWAEAGFKQGGSPGYALHRLMVSAEGMPKQVLGDGEVKCLQSDRVILVPGPRAEVECVREIYRMVVEEKRSPFYIARELNRRGLTNRGRKWWHQMVWKILTDPKYAGNNVWNRTSQRLGAARLPVPRFKWIIRSAAFEPVVDPRLFTEAQRILGQRTCAKTNEQLLDDLRQLLKMNGKLTTRLLETSDSAPSYHTCVKRFGSARRAFELASYSYPQSSLATMERCRNKQKIREQLQTQIISMFPNNVTIHHFHSKRGNRALLEIDSKLKVSVLICRTMSNRKDRWKVDDKYGERRYLCLLGRLRPGTDDLQDLYVVPPLGTKCRIMPDDKFLTRGRQLFDLSEFCSAVRAVNASLTASNAA